MTRGTFIDTGDEIVEVPWGNIEGRKQKPDGSWIFQLVGGPYHDNQVRVYPPCDRIVFPAETNPVVYEINPPLRKNGKWCYIYNADGDTSPMATTKIIRKKESIFDK
jgi:hypothetical protein